MGDFNINVDVMNNRDAILFLDTLDISNLVHLVAKSTHVYHHTLDLV